MEPTLIVGDQIIITKFAYGYTRVTAPWIHGRVLARAPERGDVAVFKLPRDGRTNFIKRVIGLPGDRVQMKGGVLWLNGRQIPRETLPSVWIPSAHGFTRTVARIRETLPNGRQYVTYDYGADAVGDNTDLFIVPAGHYFVIGDNRDDSLDSRFSRMVGTGFVPAENLIGRAELILLSWSPGASLRRPETWFRETRFGRVIYGP